MTTLHSRLSEPAVTVTLGEGARMRLLVDEADGSVGEVDLVAEHGDHLADLLSLGAAMVGTAGESDEPASTLGTVEVAGPVRVWVDGKGVGPGEVAGYLANAVVGAIREVVARADRRSTESPSS